ncbi:unnamed protein product [Bursaphelenchus xylophilus]|uniref:(pine wood nematode) hypothetical protein n=1 Tax=Bursaphelenchus xylophilus TaxID=6326 RepID=A0A811M0W5_BURXY|nr:unnamed protein product [Bursaphelenchus xylophilus]CAG9129971.1 unnamed protein product [Bursaphelenchus xylophilus]
MNYYCAHQAAGSWIQPSSGVSTTALEQGSKSSRDSDVDVVPAESISRYPDLRPELSYAPELTQEFGNN